MQSPPRRKAALLASCRSTRASRSTPGSRIASFACIRSAQRCWILGSLTASRLVGRRTFRGGRGIRSFPEFEAITASCPGREPPGNQERQGQHTANEYGRTKASSVIPRLAMLKFPWRIQQAGRVVHVRPEEMRCQVSDGDKEQHRRTTRTET